MTNNNIIERITDIFPEREPELIIRYGSLKGRDIDIFILFSDSLTYDRTVSGKLEIINFGITWRDLLSKNRDPIIVEPILNGRVLMDKRGIFSDIKEKIFSTQEDPVEYLLFCTISFLEWSNNLWESGDSRSANGTLGFAYAYLLYSIYYSENNYSAIFEEIKHVFGANSLYLLREMKEEEPSKDRFYTMFKYVYSLYLSIDK